VLAAAVIVVVGIAGFAWLREVGAGGRPVAAVESPGAATSTKTYSLTVAGVKRSYVLIAPVTAPPASAPVIVMLSGLGATVSQEMKRDQLIPYATAGKAEVVYPVPVQASWNAIGCCGYAGTHQVDDMAFLKALVAKVDPGRARHVYVVGYSNGARLAYRVACTDPGLFDGYAMVKGGPMTDCVVRQPVSIAQLASLDDPEVAYKPGQHGREPIPVTTEVSRLHAAEKCPATPTVKQSGTVTISAWTGCAGGARLTIAVWQDGKHSFPRPPASKPSAAAVIWAFFTQTPLAVLAPLACSAPCLAGGPGVTGPMALQAEPAASRCHHGASTGR
jgi:polyhydroxybutyrate depolymerase